MVHLQMESQPLRYELALQPAKLQINTEPAKLQLETQPAILEITSAKGELLIDHTPWRYSLGLKNNADFMRDFSSEGKQAALEAVARLAQEGHRMASIENGGNAIVQMAKESIRPPQRDLTIAPLVAPDISYQLQPANIKVQRGQVINTTIPGSINNQFLPGSFAIQITQYPSLRMWTEPTIDLRQ